MTSLLCARVVQIFSYFLHKCFEKCRWMGHEKRWNQGYSFSTAIVRSAFSERRQKIGTGQVSWVSNFKFCNRCVRYSFNDMSKTDTLNLHVYTRNFVPTSIACKNSLTCNLQFVCKFDESFLIILPKHVLLNAIHIHNVRVTWELIRKFAEIQLYNS